MGRRRIKEIVPRGGYSLYIPEDTPKELLEWMNKQRKLNQKILQILLNSMNQSAVSTANQSLHEGMGSKKSDTINLHPALQPDTAFFEPPRDENTRVAEMDYRIEEVVNNTDNVTLHNSQHSKPTVAKRRANLLSVSLENDEDEGGFTDHLEGVSL